MVVVELRPEFSFSSFPIKEKTLFKSKDSMLISGVAGMVSGFLARCHCSHPSQFRKTNSRILKRTHELLPSPKVRSLKCRLPPADEAFEPKFPLGGRMFPVCFAKTARRLQFFLTIFLMILFHTPAGAQSPFDPVDPPSPSLPTFAEPKDRVSGYVDDEQRITLHGNRHP